MFDVHVRSTYSAYCMIVTIYEEMVMLSYFIGKEISEIIETERSGKVIRQRGYFSGHFK